MLLPILSTVEKAAQDALREVATEGLAIARELAPKEDLELVRSGGVRVEDLTAQVSFTAKHAIFQHENAGYEHPNGGQAKFLEAAVDQMTPQIEAKMAARVRQALGG